MELLERALLLFCRPETIPAGTGGPLPDLANALNLLRREYPDLSEIVHGRDVLDFGCGFGRQAIALAQSEDCRVVGLDTNGRHLSEARESARSLGLNEDRLVFIEKLEARHDASFDIVISQNSMEHFPDPRGVLSAMARLIRPGGLLLVTFGPPWYAPYGSHMHFFCRLPWVNLLFPERVVMKVRNRYRDDGAVHYEEVESGLNRMSLRRFERLLRACDLRVLEMRHRGVKGFDLPTRVPLLRELFTIHVSCILAKGGA